MSKLLQNIKIGLDETIEEKLELLSPEFSQYRIHRKSVDARRSSDPHWVVSVEVFEKNETPPLENFDPPKISFPKSEDRPLIIGSGPAGLFAALRFVERGVPCVLLERGSLGPKRINAINRFWRYGELDLDNNVCFGEGGAGLYSDGKLITRIKSEHIPYVMDRLVRFGAPSEIKYLANPHVGSDRIRRVIPNLRQYLEANGCEMHFDTAMQDLLVSEQQNTRQVIGVRSRDGREFFAKHVILATGHSAEDIFSMLEQKQVFMEGKSFALGLRIEHPQAQINRIQYRKHAERTELGAANYKLAEHDHASGVGVYSFCMCPGGLVLSSGTEADGIVCNGMSNYNRNSPFANSAMVVSVQHEKLFGSDLFGGMKFRKALEQDALKRVRQAGGTKHLPAQRVVDFLKGRLGPANKSSSPSGVVPVRLDELLPKEFTQYLRQSLEVFDSKMRGFISDEAQFHGVESRTSCPIRVTRDEQSYESLSHKGLYPCGEGAGYAGGITSAACDGVRVADSITDLFASQSAALTQKI